MLMRFNSRLRNVFRLLRMILMRIQTVSPESALSDPTDVRVRFKRLSALHISQPGLTMNFVVVGSSAPPTQTRQHRKTYGNGEYIGDMENNQEHGYGHMTYDSGDWYKGNFRHGKRHGLGEYHWAAGGSYKGEYVKGKKHGHGVRKWRDGRLYDGGWKKDKQHGHGVWKSADGVRRRG